MVNVRYVGTTYNVEIPGDGLNVALASQNGYADPVSFAHNGAASYYLGLPNLFTVNAGHVVNGGNGIEAHYDAFGPYNPLHWALEYLPSTVVNPRSTAQPMQYSCSVSGGCQQQ